MISFYLLSIEGLKSFSLAYAQMVMEVGVDHSKDASLMTENRAKNRYTNILACECVVGHI